MTGPRITQPGGRWASVPAKALPVIALAVAAGVAPNAAALLAQTTARPTIIVIGGMKQGLPDAEHDFPDGALKIDRLIKASPEFARLNPVVKVFPVGFPKNLAEIEDANVVVLYTGMQRTGAGNVNPVQDPAVARTMTRLMERGVGLVALHQSFTVPDKSSAAPFVKWLGGARIAVTDYTFETAPMTVVTRAHPIANGITGFDYLDEFYPTVELGTASGTTPILNARIHVQHRRSGPAFEEPARKRIVAWAHERPGGGRAFAFTGGHYLASFDQRQVRTMVLNAILWAAHAEVPRTGATSSVPLLQSPGQSTASPLASHRVILPITDVKPEPQPWGTLRWFASRPLGNSTRMTVGEATITPGKSNPPHWHPNCDEILHVVRGHIIHRVGDKQYEMRTGDTVVIPEGIVHNARNIGTEDAVLAVSFNSADRVAIGE